MKRNIKTDACGANDRLTIMQMRGMLQLIQASVEHDEELCEFSAHLRNAMANLDELRTIAHTVMIEAEADRSRVAGCRSVRSMKLC